MSAAANDASAALVEVRDLSKHFGRVAALERVSLSIVRGQIVGLAGPNGAGKTTLLHILLGLVRPSSGQVSVFGLSPLTQRHRVLPRLNFASTYATLPTNLTVLENLTIFAGIYGLTRPRAKIDALCELFGVQHLQRRLVGALSSGEKTRLNLCKALLNDPELLLLDEPTASLDPEMADTVRGCLLDLHRDKGLGILYTSHNMAEIERLCDRVQFLHRGRTLVEDTPRGLIERYGCSSLEEVFIHLVRTGRKQETAS